MKTVTVVLVIALSAACITSTAIPSIELLEKRCIPDGARCRKDDSMGACCSTFCLQYENAEEGTCEVNED